MIKELSVGMIGFSEGMVVGGAVVAFLTILDIVPRLCWITRTTRYITCYETAMVGGAVTAALCYFLKPRLFLGDCFAAVLGGFLGIFIGLIAAALAEVTNVMPVISRRIGIEGYIGIVYISLIIGKMTGSMLYWIFPKIWS